MGLLDVLLLKLAPALAKSLLRIWLKDEAVARDASLTVVDLLRERTGDLLAHQRGKREFEAISERIAENLLPIFEANDVILEDSDCESVIFVAAEALSGAGISSELLARIDLDPTDLTEHLLKGHPPGLESLSSTQHDLYKRVISEASQYMVDIASSLPVFSEKTLAEILKRERQLLEVAEGILAEVRHLRFATLKASESEAWFEAEYRRTMIRKLDQLELFGATTSSASRRQRLTIAYISLSVEVRSVGEREAENADDDDAPSESASAETLLGASERLLIRGDAGSGKTTLLKWIAVNAAGRKFEGDLIPWNGCVPFFVRLRQCTDSGLPSPESLPALIAPVLHDNMPEGWATKQLRDGNAILLVDGIDEIQEVRRNEVREWISDMASSFQKIKIVVTSRPHAVGDYWMDTELFANADLLPMENQDIVKFVEQWHSAVKEETQSTDEEEALEQLSPNLISLIKEKTSLNNLATNPLLCAMICALHRDRRQQLPADRIELYEACCQMLLERRDIERRVQLQDYPVLSYRQKCALLQDLSYHMIRNGWSQISTSKADARIDGKLSYMAGLGDVFTGEKIRKLLTERSGLIREPVEGEVDFTHRTFQEYLAAQAILDEGDLGVLIDNAHNYQWREVVILAAGRSGMKTRGEIIGGIIERGEREADSGHALHLLAVACLEASVELAPDIADSVRQKLGELVPPANMTEAKELAAAGELAIPYLQRVRGARASETAATIRALSLIGGESSLNALEKFKHDTRVTVVDELFRAWSGYDRQEYVVRVLSSVKKIGTRLMPAWQESSEALWCLRGLRKLRLLSVDASFSGINRLVNLEELAIADCSKVSSLRSMACRRIRVLALDKCDKLCDVSTLASLSSLERLGVGYCGEIDNMDGISDLARLRSLGLYGVRSGSDLSVLVGCAAVEELRLHFSGCVGDLSWLSGLDNLKRLSLSCESASDEVSPTKFAASLDFSKLGKLRDLEIKGGVWDIESLVGLKELRRLVIRDCKSVGCLDRAVSTMERLSFLWLPSTIVPYDEPSSLLELKKVSCLMIDVPLDQPEMERASQLIESVDRASKASEGLLSLATRLHGLISHVVVTAGVRTDGAFVRARNSDGKRRETSDLMKKIQILKSVAVFGAPCNGRLFVPLDGVEGEDRELVDLSPVFWMDGPSSPSKQMLNAVSGGLYSSRRGPEVFSLTSTFGVAYAY